MSAQPPSEPPSDPLVGIELNGYQIRSVMAEGGMGKVYLGVHPMVGAKAAIKVMLPQFAEDQEQVERFVREARVLATLNHDRIVKIMGFGTLPDGRQYMITEHLEGALLSRLIEREAPMNPARALNLLDQMLDALSAAHAAGVVHRDLKPANVIVKAVGTEKKLKLLDFGLARARVVQANADPTMPLNKASQVMGTPEYMAPEQARGFAPTPASDLYSLGVMAFEMLTHRLPFLATNVFEMMKHHVNTTPPKIGVLVPSMPQALEDLVTQLLSKAPEDRGAPAERVRKVVQQILRELPEPENPARKMSTGEWKIVQGGGGAPITAAPSKKHPTLVPGEQRAITATASARMPAPVITPTGSDAARAKMHTPQGPLPVGDLSRRPSNPAATPTSESSRKLAALTAEPARSPANIPVGSPATPQAMPVAKVDPAWAAAREKAQPQQPVRHGVSPVVLFFCIAVAALCGIGYERYRASKVTAASAGAMVEISPSAKPAPGGSVKVDPAAVLPPPVVAGPDSGGGVEAAPPAKPVEVATPEVRDPRTLCKDVPHWRNELLDNVKTMRSLYLSTHPGSKADKPPVTRLTILRDQGMAVATSAECEKVQKHIDDWETQNMKPK
jgi:serine/threonine protein kinase